LGKQSTTSRRTSSAEPLEDLIAALPLARAAAAFTHASWAPERSSSYERLEFLGDSVLELAIAHSLYERFPDFTEGQMAKIRSHVVSRASCAVVARRLQLGERLLEVAGGAAGAEIDSLAKNRNVLAAILEAAIAGAFEPRIEFALHHQVDHKTELQETLARSGKSVSYVLLDADGPPHDRTFTAAAMVDGEQAGIGRGSSKKDAEQEAAGEALTRIAESGQAGS
jgi:ribonuclease III